MPSSSLAVRDVSTSLEMTKRIFVALNVYYDIAPRSAALNMSIDEALLEQTVVPTIRFYRWDHPALSFGYFGRFVDVASRAPGRDLVRRWTGGGTVFHGDDLTYSIIIPAHDPAFAESSMSIYTKIHGTLRNVLDAIGTRAELAAVAAVSDRRSPIISAVGHRRYNRHVCFANPVQADVLVNGRKVAGAAQRRTRRGLLQQGSIQHIDLENGLAEGFAKELSHQINEKFLSRVIIERAQEIEDTRYGTIAWLHRR